MPTHTLSKIPAKIQTVKVGGEGGIRTPGPVTGTADFESAPL